MPKFLLYLSRRARLGRPESGPFASSRGSRLEIAIEGEPLSIRISPNKVFIVSPQDSGLRRPRNALENLVKCGRNQTSWPGRLTRGEHGAKTANSSRSPEGLWQVSLSTPNLSRPSTPNMVKTEHLRGTRSRSTPFVTRATPLFDCIWQCRRQNRIVVVTTRDYTQPPLAVDTSTYGILRAVTSVPMFGTPDDTAD